MAAPAAERDVSKTFIFFDLESTGLFPEHTVGVQAPAPRITEIAMVAITKAEFVRHISVAQHEPRQIVNLPRISKVIQLQVDPECDVPEKAAKLSGLTTELLRGQKTLHKIWPRLSDFVEDQPQPVTFIAHNGSKFDFRLLRSEIDRLQLSNILQGRFTVDSLNLFKSLDAGYAAEFVNEMDPENVMNSAAQNVTNGPANLSAQDTGSLTVTPKRKAVTKICPKSDGDSPRSVVTLNGKTVQDGPCDNPLSCSPSKNQQMATTTSYRQYTFPASPNVDPNTSVNGTAPIPKPILTEKDVDMTNWNVAKKALFRRTYTVGVGKLSYKLGEIWKAVVGAIDSDPPFPQPRWHTALDDTLALVQVSLAHGQKFVDAVEVEERLQNRGLS